jgi:hypothetical protein
MLDLPARNGDEEGAALSLLRKGRMVGRKDPTLGTSLLEESLAKQRALGDTLGMADTLRIMSLTQKDFGDFEKMAADFTGKEDAYLLNAIGCAEGKCRMDDNKIRIYSELKNRERIKWETEVVESQWRDRYVTPGEISRNPFCVLAAHH